MRVEAAEALRIATEALTRYKLRTALSVLGVVLGVAAVIAMMSVGQGAQREALAQVEALGLDNLVARSHGSSVYPVAWKGLRATDADYAMAMVPYAESASPVLRRYLRVAYAGTALTTTVLGVRASYQDILRLSIDRGRLLSANDERSLARVCVIGSSIARQLYGLRRPIGEHLTIANDTCEVIGVLRRHGTRSAAAGNVAWQDLDSTVLLPLPVVSGRTLDIARDQPIDELWLHISEGERAEEIGQVFQHTLSAVMPGRVFTVVVPRELLAQRYRTQRTFNIVVGSVAILALIVGGIGIMNIMLTSVVERTREIGVRRTCGATRRDVGAQFLVETLLMTLSGGIAGIVAGVAISWAITAFAGWNTHVSVLSVALGFLVSFGVGVTFGLYPAMKAASLEPVDAMRYE